MLIELTCKKVRQNRNNISASSNKVSVPASERESSIKRTGFSFLEVPLVKALFHLRVPVGGGFTL